MRRDLIVGPLGFDFPGRLQPIFTDELACLVARDHPRLKDGALSLDDLQHMPHAVAEFAAAGERRRPLEVELDAKGVHDRVVLVRRRQSAHAALRRRPAPTCARSCPSRLARRCLDVLDLVIATTPLDPVVITEAAHWHPRRENDPAVVWLRHLLYDVAITLEDERRMSACQ